MNCSVNPARHRDILMLALMAATLVIESPAMAARIPWLPDLDAALHAAGESGKPIMVFVHVGAMDRGTRGNPDWVDGYHQMATETLVDEFVVEAAQRFECLELDLRKRSNDASRDKLRVGAVRDPNDRDLTGLYPITLFLDQSGDESFRLHGYLPPLAYAVQLKKADQLIGYQGQLALTPDDPVVRRNLGRTYMEMYAEPGDSFHLAALDNLERAIALDPDNETGANYDARVDLAIFRLPDDPEAAFTKLFQLQAEDPDRERRFEIQYYMAVSQYAISNPQMATQILASFETKDRESPYYSNEWTAQALGLLAHIRAMNEDG